MPTLITNTKDDVLVNLPSGKVKRDGTRGKMEGQTGVTCVLSSMRKLSFFNKETNMDMYKGLKAIKKALEKYEAKEAYAVAERVFKELKLPLHEVKPHVSGFKNFKSIFPGADPNSFWETSSEHSKFFAMYLYLNKQMYKSFNIGESTWNPNQGPEGLMETLRDHGAVMVTGKYGPCFHGGRDGVCELPDLDTDGRKVYGFKPNTYVGESSNWTHAVIIDQVKRVKGTYRVFFRDPYMDSVPGAQETVFSLTYDNFIKRLYHLDSTPYDAKKPHNNPFLLHSLKPEALVNAPLEQAKSKTLSTCTMQGFLIGALSLACYAGYYAISQLVSSQTSLSIQ